jgi:hypothetical protein
MASDERVAQLRRICEQVDYYMSPANLARDAFLVGLMDMHFFVPLVFIATFPRVRSITPDIPTLIEAMRLSAKCELDSSMSCIRPVIWNCLVKYPSEKGFLIFVREAPAAPEAAPQITTPESTVIPTGEQNPESSGNAQTLPFSASPVSVFVWRAMLSELHAVCDAGIRRCLQPILCTCCHFSSIEHNQLSVPSKAGRHGGSDGHAKQG